MFVGYSPTQKGYKCYHPPCRKYFVSMDVTLRENEPYFGTTQSSLQGESNGREEVIPSSITLDDLTPGERPVEERVLEETIV